MLNFLSTIGVQSQFEKNRLILTRPNLQAPNQQSVKNILRTFSGQDEHTRSQIAFATILRKISTSKEKQNWLYLIKNLIILDRVISDNWFCQQINETNLPTVQNFIENNPKNRLIKSQTLLKKYWHSIKSLCILKSSNKHILYYKRCQRKAFIDNLQPKQILKQIESLNRLFNEIQDLIYITCGFASEDQQNLRRTQIFVQKIHRTYEQFIKSNLASYLTINFYSKLLTLFSCQYLLIHKFIQTILLTTQNEQKILTSQVIYFKKIVSRFKLTCNGMILLAQQNQNKKGFQQIQTKQFSSFNQKIILKVIEQYLQHHNTNHNTVIFENKNIQNVLTYQLCQNINNSQYDILKVDKKPLFNKNRTEISQRLTRKKLQDIENQNNNKDVFLNYFNSYSTDFPNKKMMTIDLIEDIRKTEIQNKLSSKKSIYDCLDEQNQQKYFINEFQNVKCKTKWNDLLSFIKKEGQVQNQQASTNQNSDFGMKSLYQKQASLKNFINLNSTPRHYSVI